MNPIREAAIQYIEEAYNRTDGNGNPVTVETLRRATRDFYSDTARVDVMAEMTDGVYFSMSISPSELIAWMILDERR